MEGLNTEEITNKKFYNPHKSLNHSNYLNIERNANNKNDLPNNNIEYEKYKNNFYTFKEFKFYHKNYKFYKLNIPHYSFYHYSDKSLYINEPYKTNLLKEASELKKKRKKLQLELNLAKKEKLIKNKYIKTLEDNINERENNKYEINVLNKFSKDKLLVKKTNHKKNFNYNEYKYTFILNNNIKAPREKNKTISFD